MISEFSVMIQRDIMDRQAAHNQECQTKETGAKPKEGKQQINLHIIV